MSVPQKPVSDPYGIAAPKATEPSIMTHGDPVTIALAKRLSEGHVDVMKEIGSARLQHWQAPRAFFRKLR